MRKVKKGVVVAVIAGDDKGKNGKVLEVSGDKVIVEGVNVVKKFVKKGLLGKNSEGSIIDLEKSIHISNVKVVEGSEVKIVAPKSEKKKETSVKVKKTVTKKKAKLDKKEE